MNKDIALLIGDKLDSTVARIRARSIKRAVKAQMKLAFESNACLPLPTTRRKGPNKESDIDYYWLQTPRRLSQL